MNLLFSWYLLRRCTASLFSLAKVRSLAKSPRRCLICFMTFSMRLRFHAKFEIENRSSAQIQPTVINSRVSRCSRRTP